MTTARTLTAANTMCAPRSNANLLERAHRFITLAKTRRALAQLDLRMLDDIGLCTREAQLEAARPFWDAPAFWRK
ncbi:DUF1127 domain-containing protein [Planktotalea arctica]|uniref:DUF1127 domain-containing protein n=1 Tax=Planktotalea arctica TaxID=1481893 RepID=UPI000A173EFE|nr:DUF1127 domain-containing protein [Planktotalea arctica]